MAWKASCKLAKDQQYWLIMPQQIVIDIPASLATLVPTSQTAIEIVTIIAFWAAVSLVVCVLYLVISWLNRVQKRVYAALFLRPAQRGLPGKY